jgi:hypothetical protein
MSYLTEKDGPLPEEPSVPSKLRDSTGAAVGSFGDLEECLATHLVARLTDLRKQRDAGAIKSHTDLSAALKGLVGTAEWLRRIGSYGSPDRHLPKKK